MTARPSDWWNLPRQSSSSRKGKSMTTQANKLLRLRQFITENLRIQRGGGQTPPYIDVSNSIVDICSRQNHAVFARRGCGKTLLLHDSNRHLDPSIKSVYLNCEDFKHHSFPNVLIEILDALFAELEKHLTGWFGKKRRSRQLITGIRNATGAAFEGGKGRRLYK